MNLPIFPARSTRFLAIVVLLSGVGLLGPGTIGLKAAEPDLLHALLTPEEFHRAGLDQLTPQQLKFLEAKLEAAGLRLRTAAPAKSAVQFPTQAVMPAPARASTEVSVPRGEAAFGREREVQAKVEKSQEVPSTIQSRIEGAFHGWRGNAVFHLTNGQVWRQVDSSQFAVSLESPVVVIEKGMFGAYYLHVEGYGTRVKVRRIR